MTKYRQFQHEDSICEQIERAFHAIDELLKAIDIHTTVDGAILVPDDWQCRCAIQDAAKLAHHELHGVAWLVQEQPQIVEFQPLRADPSYEWLRKFCLNISSLDKDQSVASSDVEKAKKKFAGL